MGKYVKKKSRKSLLTAKGSWLRVTDKVNIPELQNRLQRRIDLIIETARDLSKLRASKVEA